MFCSPVQGSLELRTGKEENLNAKDAKKNKTQRAQRFFFAFPAPLPLRPWRLNLFCMCNEKAP
jgi:hypothetical protein